MAYPLYAIGLTYPPTPFSAYDPPIPWPAKSDPDKYPVVFTRGDSTTAGHGFPYTILTFQFLEQAELDHLLGLLTVSGVLQKSRSGIYLHTLKPEQQTVFATYQCVMHLPEKLSNYRQPGGLYVNLPFQFTRLIPYPS